QPPAPDFADWVFADTHGHPFYLMEALKDLLERGALHANRRTAGQWTFSVDEHHELGIRVRVPSTVGAVVRSRLNRLSPDAFALLTAGAVLEQPITFERMCVTGNIHENAGLPALDELLSSRLLLEAAQPAAGSSSYAFPNEMIRDVVYTDAGDARRRLFHRRALDVLSAAQAPAAVLAHHALMGGLAAPALRYCRAAGEEALRLLAASEAVVHFERARDLLQGGQLAGTDVPAQLRDLYPRLERAYILAGRHTQATAIREALAALE
ncbi:MAG: hypothetical protein ABI847_08050, partial [Anaerolineales bacterium]